MTRETLDQRIGRVIDPGAGLDRRPKSAVPFERDRKPTPYLSKYRASHSRPGGDGESQKQQQGIRSGHSRALANVRMLYADHLSLASPLESVISLHYPPVINLQNGLIL